MKNPSEQEQHAMRGIEKGLNLHDAGEHRLVIGEKTEGLKDTSDLNIGNATFTGLKNFVVARKENILSRASESHFRADTRKTLLTLHIGEGGRRKAIGEANAVPAAIITAQAKKSEDFEYIEKMLGKTHDSAHDLFKAWRQRPHIFENETEWSRVIGAMRDTNLKVAKLLKDTSNDAGAREKHLKAEVTDGQLDLQWNFKAAIFEGETEELIPAKAIWEVQDDFTVKLVLLNGGIVEQIRNAEKLLMKNTVASIEETLGANVVPVVYVD